MKKNPLTRVNVYVDGFNLYFGLIAAQYHNYKWLDIRGMSENLLINNQQLCEVKYFTSYVRNNQEKEKRQKTYLEAIETKGVQLILGKYQLNREKCYSCGNSWSSPNEKMTDVNIATHLMIDAFNDCYDTALLISGDTDLVPPVKAVLNQFSNKKIIVVFPPKRFNNQLKSAGTAHIKIRKSVLKKSQLPQQVVKPDGYTLKKPDQW